MKKKQVFFKDGKVTDAGLAELEPIHPNLILVFGPDTFFENKTAASAFHKKFPKAIVAGCSSAGEISDQGVSDSAVVVTAIQFEKAKLTAARSIIPNMEASADAGKKLGQELKSPGLKALLVFGVGTQINGSALIAGLQSAVGENVILTGGLAADAGKFTRTWTLFNDQAADNQVVGVGFEGAVEVGFGSMGGWEPFGPVRKVTKAVGNVMLELDGKPALQIYKEYLGSEAKGLPASGLMFPFALLKSNVDNSGLIRTILAVDETKGSLTFAGDIPVNGYVRLMHSKLDKLVTGAEGAAKLSLSHLKNVEPGVAILVSCIGRKLVMGDDTEDEIDAVKNIFAKGTVVTGFYSNGEICPQVGVADCKLHNQTMTITYLMEK